MNDDAPGPKASRWWLNSALARLAFASSTQDGSGRTPQTPSMALLQALQQAEVAFDLDDAAQREFGDYELLELIGQGGMGLVYRARQRDLDREVAIKLLSAGPHAPAALVDMLRREALHAAALQHPNIVTVHELGEHAGLLFYAMQLVRGRSLSQRLEQDGPLAPREAARLLRTIAEAMHYAHQLGVLHLDVKPGNLLLDERDAPLIADFGLARRLEQVLEPAHVAGTPSYMAPEQARTDGPPLSPATDVWALGAVLYETVTGHAPFEGGDPATTLRLLVEGKVRRPSRYAKVPADLEAICLKCLRKDPAERYPDARALADDLGRFLEGRQVSVRPLDALQRMARWARREPRLAGAVAFALLALLGGVIAASLQSRRAEANAATASARLWESRSETALQLEQDGKGWDALPRLLANIDEEDRAGRKDLALLERRRVGILLGQGAVLIDRTVIADAKPLAVELSDDARLLAIGFNDQSVRWYDATTLRERGRVDLADRPTSDDQPRVPLLLRFIDSHRLLVTLDWLSNLAAPNEGDSWIVDLDHRRVIEPPTAFADFAEARFSADGGHALLLDHRQHVQCWQVDPWRACSPLAPLLGPGNSNWKLGRNARYALALSPNQVKLTFFDPHDLSRPIATLTPPGSTGTAAWMESHDGHWLALGDFEGRLFLVDLQTKAVRQLPTPRSREVTWLAFSQDDAWLAAVTWDGYAYAFDVATGNPLVAGQMQHDFVPQRVGISRRERLLVVSGGGKVYGPGGSDIALWRLPEAGARAIPATRIGIAPAGYRDAGRYPVGWSADTGLLASAGVDGEVRLWRLPLSPQVRARAANQLPEQLQFDGRHVVDVEWNRLRLVTLDGAGATGWLTLPQPPGFAELIDNGRTLVVTSGPQLRVYDTPGLRLRYPPLALPASPQRLLASADGARLATTYGSSDATGYHEQVLVHDLRRGRRLPAEARLPGPLRALAFSSDHTRLLIGGAPADAVWVYATDTLRRIGEHASGAFQPVTGEAFARDQHDVWLATLANPGMGDNALLRWNPDTGALLERRNLGAVQPVSTIDTDAGPFVAGIEAELIDPGGPHAKRPRRLTLDDTERAVALSADGRLLARTFVHHAQVLDLATGTSVGAPLASDIPAMDSLWLLAFSPDGRQLLGRTLRGYWVHWRIGADARPIGEIAAGPGRLGGEVNRAPVRPGAAERAALRAGDPGAWPPPEVPPSPRIARWLAGLPIPARAPGTSPLLLDLTATYDFGPETVHNNYFAVLPSLRPRPVGVQRIAGVDYDLRGMTQIDGRYPEHGVGVPVPARPIAAFHLLMTVSIPIPIADVQTVAKVRLHYVDGSQAVLPIRTQREVPGYTAHDMPVPLAWAQYGGMPTLGVRDLVFSAPRLPNPHPERLIRSLDLELGEHGAVFPSLYLAITAEPVIPAAFSRNTQTQGAVGKASRD